LLSQQIHLSLREMWSSPVLVQLRQLSMVDTRMGLLHGRIQKVVH
jgi:hypothetical protein